MPRKKSSGEKKAPTKKKVYRAKKTAPRKTELESDYREEKKGAASPEKPAAEPKYISIRDIDPEMESRTRLTWIIVGIIGCGIVIFWFWTLRSNILKAGGGEEVQKIAQQISQNIDELKNIISSAQNNGDLQQNQNSPDIEKIKNETLKQIELNLDSASWPEHISEPLKLAVKYPSAWSKQEDAGSLILSSYDNKDDLPPSLGQLIITNKGRFPKTTLTDWADKNLDDQYSFDQEVFVDFQPAVKYLKSDAATTTDISYSIFVQKNDNIYEISAYGRNGRDIYGFILEKIISTIKFSQ